MDREAAARAIVERSRRERRALPRAVWTVSLLVAGICIVALALALAVDWNTPPAPPLPRAARAVGDSGFGFGLAIGLAIGVAAGWLAAARRR